MFDKTGTLTEGNFGVSKIVSMGNLSEEKILELVAGLESRSEHSIARGIVKAAGEKDVSFSDPKEFKAIPGKGAQGTIDGKNVKVVSPKYLNENQINLDNETLEKLSDRCRIVVFLLVDDRLQCPCHSFGCRHFISVFSIFIATSRGGHSHVYFHGDCCV